MKNKGGFFKKLFSVFIISSLLLSAIFFITAKSYIKSSNLDFFTHELNTKAAGIMPFISDYFIEGKQEKMHASFNEMAENLNSRITLVDTTGKVLYDSEYDYSTMPNHANRKEISEVLAGAASGKIIRYSSTFEGEMLYMAVPIESEGNLYGVLRLSMPISEINIFTVQTLKNIATVFIFVILISFFAAYFISKKMTAGISAMQEAVLQMSKGDLKVKAFIGSNDEIGELALSFNKMSEEIDKLFKEVNESKEMLDKVLASVSNGIILLDKDYRTILFNDQFKKIFKNVSEGRFFWEYLRNRSIEADFEKVKEKKESLVIGEIEFDRRVLEYTISKVKSEDKFVVSVKDITGMKNLENFKKDFISNASHELKTPITAIVGFAEMLGDESSVKENKRYIEIIKKQAQRLSNIISDLLSLSYFENSPEIEKTDIGLPKVINNVADFYRKKISDKEIEIKTDIEDGLKTVYANEFNIEQLLINLVDNAVKYTEKGEIIIKAINDKSSDFVELSVSDTGIGIHEKHISRLFERFYVVDKSRSKKTGGTGLGLSIVKHIVSIHNGKIFVESKEGKGSVFYIKLPIK